MTTTHFDIVIVGAGPAGIQAAIHAARRKVQVLILGRPENSALYNAHVENYAFVPGVSMGADMLAQGLAQATGFGAAHWPEDVLKIEQDGERFALETESGRRLLAHAIIFTMGIAKKKLGVEGEKTLTGRGVSYCVDCDANFYRGATVAVTGNRSAAVDGALTLLSYAAKVYLLAQDLDVSPELLERLESSGVEVRLGARIEALEGRDKLEAVVLEGGERIALDGLFIELGSKGALELATQVGVMLDTENFKYIAVNRRQETNVPGIYAAGDITGPPYQVAKAVGEGCVAGMEAAAYARKRRKAQDSAD